MKCVRPVWFYMNYQINQIFVAPVWTRNFFWDFSRYYFYALAFWSLLSAKVLHLYVHLHSLPPSKFLLWGITFFFQDAAILLLLRVITQRSRWWPLVALSALVIPFGMLISAMTAASFSVYVLIGAEIHWRQAKIFTGDAAAVRTLLSGLTGVLISEGILWTVTLFTARPIYEATGGILRAWEWPFRLLLSRLRTTLNTIVERLRNRSQAQSLPDPRAYEHISLEDNYLTSSDDSDEEEYLLSEPNTNPRMNMRPTKRVNTRLTDKVLTRNIIIGVSSLFLLLRCLRPSSSVYLFLSGTLPLVVVFEGVGQRLSPVDVTGMPEHYNYLYEASSLYPPPKWSWMPKDPVPGFEDWDKSDPHALHYDASKSPLHISNLQEPVLEQIHNALADGNVKIKHVVLLKLESTRADVFPLRKDSFMFERIAKSYKNQQIPYDVQQRIANLTSTAEYLTGSPTGFTDNSYGGRKAYGGLSATNAYTTSTYTLKSVEGTVCGVTPLVVDFNREWQQHIYQPCLPHVFDMLSRQHGITSETDDFTRWPWHSAWMQSVTDTYDNQYKLTPVLGYNDKTTKEIIEQPSAKHFPLQSGEINYYGYADTELREYIRDAIVDAEREHKRLFLTHLTGTTHHPWGLPTNTFEQIMGPSNRNNDDLNRYLNSLGFVDGWLETILEILKEEGVANETLLVMAGDHGLSLPNDGGITPYDNPHVGNFHVPLVLAHPHLPSVQINAPVSSNQIVPSIIDLLIESSSLHKKTKRVATDIRSLYEGQSLIRRQISKKGKRSVWHFTVMNTGGSWLALRSAARPELRLVIPLVNSVEWRFSDLQKDPNEVNPILRFNLADLALTLRVQYDESVLHWLWDAAYVANWWVAENWHLYRYDPLSNLTTSEYRF